MESWKLFGLTRETCKGYLSDAQYCGMHPLNGRFSAWIDDKLTLKYLCTGTMLDPYMPQYYFQIDESGRILPLMDYPTERSVANVEEILALLRAKTELAVKLIVGTIGQGFYKAEYKDGTYFLNGTPYSTSEMCAKLSSLRNYVFTEYFHPHPESARMGPGRPAMWTITAPAGFRSMWMKTAVLRRAISWTAKRAGTG